MQSTPAINQPITAATRSPQLPQRNAPLTCRERFLRACHLEPVDRPPVWMMRQAGRALPEYRALKEQFTFLELVRHPHLAAEVTLQPVRRFGFDAAIIFSDILVIPEALGQRYFFRESGGVEMEFPIRSIHDVRKLDDTAIEERLGYVPAAIRLTRRQLGSDRALLGFAGSPWTLANFMLEGGSSKNYQTALTWMQERPESFRLLMEKLTQAIIAFLKMQVAAGVDAIQIFDSLGGLLPDKKFRLGSGHWMAQIVKALEEVVPVIVFSKGTRDWGELVQTGANVIGIDQDIDLAAAVARLPDTVAVQGNLDPELLLGDPAAAAAETRRLIAEMEGRNGWIFNLGHGLRPATRLECITAALEALQN